MSEPSPTERRAAQAFLLFAGLLGLYLLKVAWRLPIDYWDGYEYLGNALALSGRDVSHLEIAYIGTRPPFTSLLLAPVLWGYRAAGGGTALVGVHGVMLAVAALAVWACFRMLRDCFSLPLAAFATLTLALNPLLVHYAPFAMADVPSLLFCALALWLYPRAAARSGKAAVGLAFALAGAFLSKYPALLLGGAPVLAELLYALVPEKAARATPLLRRLWQAFSNLKLWLSLALSLVLFYGVHVFVFARVFPGKVDPWRHLPTVIETALTTSIGAFISDPKTEYLSTLAFGFTPPLLALAVVGAGAALLRRSRQDLVHVVWSALFLGVMSLYVGHKEARYVLPVVPSVLYLQARGLELLWALLRRRVPLPWAPAAAAVLLLAWPEKQALAELRKFEDPVYSRPFLPEVARWIRDRSTTGDEEIVLMSAAWAYSIYPKNPQPPLPTDEFYYFHHVNHLGMQYFLDRQVRALQIVPMVGATTRLVRDASHHLQLITTPDIAASLQNAPTNELLRLELFTDRGFTWFHPSGQYDVMTPTIPEPPNPLTLEFVQRRTLVRGPAVPNGASYTDARTGSPALSLVAGERGWQVTPALEPGWVIYERPRAGGPASRLAPGLAPPDQLELMKIERTELHFR